MVRQASVRGVLLLCGLASGRRLEVNLSLVHNLPDDGAWKYEETRKLAFEQIGRCRDPESARAWDEHAGTSGPLAWEAGFAEAVHNARAGSVNPHVLALYRPLDSLSQRFGVLSKGMPWHRAVALTSDRDTSVPRGEYYPDSHCFTFNYSSYREGVDPDPHGCGFFRKSFEQMQRLRQCIVGKLKESPAWGHYSATASRILEARRQGISLADNPLVVTSEDIEADSIDMTFDSIRRADEIVKSVGFKPWETKSTAAARHEVERKIRKTASTKSKTTVLEPHTVAAIRRDCFYVADEGDAPLSAEAVINKRAIPCYQLMWDQAEVAGAPEQPLSNAITMWDGSLKYKATVERDYDTPPVCARAALALIAEKQKRAPGGYSMSCGLTSRPSWKTCTNPAYFNCICLSMCWRTALKRVCELESGCCDPTLRK